MACIETITVEGDTNNVVSVFKEYVDGHFSNFGNKHWGSIDKRDIKFPHKDTDFVSEDSASDALRPFVDNYRYVAFAAKYGNKWLVQAVCND